jgi:hypothetical protein
MLKCTRASMISVAVLFFAASPVILAQVPDTCWTQLYGDGTFQAGYSVRPTFDGGYIIAGETGYEEGQTPRNLWLLKTDENGDTTWTKTYGGEEDECAYDVIQTTDSGYAVVGYTETYGTVYYEDIWFLKMAGNGDTLWAHTIDLGPIHGMADQGSSVRQTTDGGFIITGYTCDAAGLADVCLVKTDSAGIVEWTKTYGTWNRSEYGIEVEQTFDGGYIVGGYGHQYSSDYRVWILKTYPNGDTAWTKTYSSPGYNDCYSIQQTSDSGYIYTGETAYGAGNGDLLLFKLDSNGDSVWAKTYGGTENDYGLAVRHTADDCYIITGQTSSFGSGLSNLCLIKADANGDTIWTRVWGGNWSEIGISVEQTPDCGYIITGRCQINSYNHDLWMLKTYPDLGITENEITYPREFLNLHVTPNPFHHSTTIRYTIHDPGSTEQELRNSNFEMREPTLKIYDAAGRLVRNFLMPTTYYLLPTAVSWDGKDQNDRQLGSGVYFVKLKTGEFTETQKIMLVR